jgi:hypothetical protein
VRLLMPSTLAKDQKHEYVDEQHGTTNSCAGHDPRPDERRDRQRQGSRGMTTRAFSLFVALLFALVAQSGFIAGISTSGIT